MPRSYSFTRDTTSRALAVMIILSFFCFPAWSSHSFGEADEIELYNSIDFTDSERPQFDIFQRAYAGYLALRHSGKLSPKKILTIIDFRKSANEKRMWVIDLKDKKVIFHSLTAHGRNTGDLFAQKFSNTPNSNQSSLGFYVTGQKYIGKHGLSLKLHGVEKGINDMAEARAIVMHGAEYVSESFIKKHGRLGRSFGCPSVPMGLHKEIIRSIADGTCLFIFYPDASYLARSKFDRGTTSDVNTGGR